MFRFRVDVWISTLLRTTAAMVFALVAFLVAFLVRQSWPALHGLGARLVADESWHPAPKPFDGTFGMAPMVAGSVAVAVGAVALAAPFGASSAVFCQFYAPRRLAAWYRRLVGLLAGIPSVVFGLWGLVTLAPLIARWEPPGQSLLAGIIVVALMVLPTIMLVVDSSLAAVPNSYLVGASALGMGRWSIVRSIALPAARHGLVAAIVLALARAAGETMAVVMVCGNSIGIPAGLFDPVRTLTANIALEMGYALGVHRSALFGSGLLLLALTIALVTANAAWERRFSSSAGSTS